MNRPILVTGGSGTLGSAVVARLLAAGHQVRVLSRRPRPTGGPAAAEWLTGDLLAGDGLAGAAAGVGAADPGIGAAVDDPARHPVPPAAPAGGRGPGPAAGGAGAGRHQLLAGRRRRGRRAAGRACHRPASRSGARGGRPPGPHRHQPAARLPARGRAAPAGAAGLAARRDLRRLPPRRPPGPRPRGRAPHLGGVPGRTG
jgi:NAD dependent epimerase/dehydratase family